MKLFDDFARHPPKSSPPKTALFTMTPASVVARQIKNKTRSDLRAGPGGVGARTASIGSLRRLHCDFTDSVGKPRAFSPPRPQSRGRELGGTHAYGAASLIDAARAPRTLSPWRSPAGVVLLEAPGPCEQVPRNAAENGGNAWRMTGMPPLLTAKCNAVTSLANLELMTALLLLPERGLRSETSGAPSEGAGHPRAIGNLKSVGG